MDQLLSRGKRMAGHGVVFVRWVLFSAVIGVVVGLVSSAFYLCFAWATGVQTKWPWLLYLLPVGGAAIALLYRVCGMEKDRGTNFVLVAVREDAPLRLRTAPLVFLSTILTHLLGGSSGREGAILQIGGSISSKIGQWTHLDEKDRRVITMCGMSAAFAALFGTPLAAAIFAMEVVSVGVLYYAALVPCTLSALIGVWVAGLCGVAPTAFPLSGVPALEPLPMLQVLGLGLLLAVVSILFCRIMHGISHLYDRFFTSHLLRGVVGGLLVVLLTLLVGCRDYNGAGSAVIAAAIGGQARPEAFLLKIIFTALTLGAGFKGGEIVPAFFAGSTFGCVAAPLLGLPTPFGAALGMVAVFCGVTNCPLTSLLLAFEVFGGGGLPFFAIVCAVTYMLSGYDSLYSEQKILYGKYRAEYINQKANPHGEDDNV